MFEIFEVASLGAFVTDAHKGKVERRKVIDHEVLRGTRMNSVCHFWYNFFILGQRDNSIAKHLSTSGKMFHEINCYGNVYFLFL